MKSVNKIRIVEIKNELYSDQAWFLEKPKMSKQFKKKLREKKEEEAYKFYRKNKKELKKVRNRRLAKFANQLNQDLPPSEKWFWHHYKKHKHINDIANRPWGPFIYDVFNSTLKYVIEIDGESHNSDNQKQRDSAKNDFAIRNGFLILRIEAYSGIAFKRALSALNKYRYNKNHKSTIESEQGLK